jgi:hypothetical protein
MNARKCFYIKNRWTVFNISDYCVVFMSHMEASSSKSSFLLGYPEVILPGILGCDVGSVSMMLI